MKRFASVVATFSIATMLSAAAFWAVADETASDKPRVVDLADLPAPQSPEKKLDEAVDFSFQKAPLTQVIEEAAKRHKLEIIFDKTVLTDAGIDPAEREVSAELKGISLRSALSLILREHGLSAVPQQGELLRITTKEDAECFLETRVFGVVDLVEIETHADPHCDKLIDLITVTVDYHTWSELGGPGTIHGWNGMLTVSQTSSAQRTIEQLLAALRETRKQQAAGKVGKATFIGSVQPAPAKLEKLLSLPTTLNYPDTSFADVLADLKNRVGIDFQLKHDVLTDAGRDPASMIVSFSVRDTSARTAIKQLFDLSGLTWIYKNEVPLITTKDDADTELMIGVYPIADLAGPHSQTELEKKLEFPVSTADELIDLITGTVETASWSELGGPGQVEAFDAEYPVLVFAQTTKVHGAIGVLLEDLRRTRRAQAEELAKHATQPVQPPPMVIQTYALRPGDQNVPAVPPKEIALLIKALTGPKIWEQEEAFIQGFTGKLIVKHTPGVQRKVRKILQEIEVLSVPQGGGFGGGSLRGGGRGVGGGGF
jgi:hypothetical protein